MRGESNVSGLRRAPRRATISVIAATAGFATAVLAGGITMAKTFTLQVADNASVTNQSNKTTHENIVVDSTSRAVYALTGDSAKHPECTKANSCYTVWPPLEVASKSQLSKAPGIRGALGVWRRDGFLQVTLNGHPLYRYTFDLSKKSARGQGIKSFGGTWHVVTPGSGGAMNGTNTTTTSTTPCLNPPYC
jgi:predicted lipoprotein with Yx(FWY)xxD motif